MMTKYQRISALANEMTKLVTKNGAEWKKFLAIVGKLYKFPFEDQILIYAQRPEATACASMEIWNEKMFCWVNRGSKGIALLDQASEHPRLRYVFDIADVHPAKRIGKKVYLWQLREEHKEIVLKDLEKTYGQIEIAGSFEKGVSDMVRRVALDYAEELLEDVLYASTGSFMEELDEGNIKVRLRDTLSESIAYTLLLRCGADMEMWENEFQFEYISEFNTTGILSVLGNAVSELSKPILIQIGQSVRLYDRQMKKQIVANREKDIMNGQYIEQPDKNVKKGLANVSQTDYNAFNTNGRTDVYDDIKKEEVQDESDIRDERRVSDSKFGSKRGNKNDAYKIRENEKELSERVSPGHIQRDVVEGRTAAALLPDTGAGGETDVIHSRENDGKRGSDRETQGIQSDAMGSKNEQYSPVSRGEHLKGTDLYLEQDTQSNTGIHNSDSDKNSLSEFFYDNEQHLDESADIYKMILCQDNFLRHKRKEIAGYFTAEIDEQKQTAYLKNCFHMNEFSELLINGERLGYLAKEEEITFWQGHYLSRKNETSLSWDAARALVSSYIEKSEYLLPGEVAEQIEVDGIYQQMTLFNMFPEQVGSIAMAQVDRESSVPEDLSLSDDLIDVILRSGGGKENSRKRIYAKYQQRKTPLQMQNFLKKEYGTTGKGFEFEGKQIAVWFDEEGMCAGYGISAFSHPLVKMGWEKIENCIRNLVENGRYISEAEAYLVNSIEYDRIANHIFFFFRDGIGEIPERLVKKIANNSESHQKLVELLSTEDGRSLITELMDTELIAIRNGEKKLLFRSIISAEELREEVINLGIEKQVFPLSDNVEVSLEDFITQDEIDHRLGKGSGYVHGSFRIYEYFSEEHDIKEKIEFLKKEYGTGGSSHALVGTDHSYENHDAKGIRLTKGNIMEPYSEVLLSWNIVAKRIEKLIKEDRYLSEEGKKSYFAYKEEKSQKTLDDAKKELENDTEEIFITKEQISSEIGKQDITAIDTVMDSVEDKGTENDNEVISNDAQSIRNFVITQDILGIGSSKEKFQRNISAIHTLKKIELENRVATEEEQKILSWYVGWGGLSEAFDERKDTWSTEYLKLKEVLSEEEYASARESTLNAHYTSPVIIRSIYNALDKFGFEKGNILEPAMGIGNFFGMLPEQMAESRLYGVELDGLTGRIAKQLYPNSNITISGFEKVDYPNNFFDIAIGNVPFGQYKVTDKAYDKYNFLIHDYFFAKTLDKVRAGGIVAFITSKGTMDKKNPSVRKYIAQRAELLGVIRLPNTAFKDNAGTEVTSDIIFLKKRDRLIDVEPEWIYLSKDEHGVEINQYFIDHPEMIMGHMEMVSGPFGLESTCIADDTKSLELQLSDAIENLSGEIESIDLLENEDELEREVLPADPMVKNYSYTLVDDKVYYRENSIMQPVEVSEGMQERIKGLVKIRDVTRNLIDLQLEEYSDDAIEKKQSELNSLYDSFSKKYGIINSRTNKRAFNQDSSYCLLCSLEKLDDEGNFKGKADMFTKRTIKKVEVITSVDTANEALAVSLSEKAKVDLAFMEELTGKTKENIIEELRGVIFQNPLTDRWETADEYLSGNVREKLEAARVYAQNHTEYAMNVQALAQVQPKELDASEIEVRIGATWIEPHFIEDFVREVFETPENLLERNVIAIRFSDVTGEWNVKGKNADNGNSLINMTYGTARRNAYQILEDSLNLKDSRVYDIVVEDGKEKRVLNKQETMIASQKQEAIREAFRNWIFRDVKRRQELVEKYNRLFNSTRPREYDGSHLIYPGMSPDIILNPHQNNAVARILYGGNTLLAHCVGAGKTFTMTAAAMESKRLGLCQKNMFVVPNHLTEQWASDFLRLYPGANILAATKKDFEPANRKKFCSRIATGDYDAVIIGHTQFERIPLSQERQIEIIERQIDEIEIAIEQVKADNGERYTIKQMEKSRKSLMARLTKLNDASRKDNVVTFEQLGVDRLFVDESHYYKNLFLYTKMRNVAGIAQSEAQKSSDMFAKCRYMDEITGGKGITFATGTPISNSMTELYTNMRYLQYDTLQKLGLGHFDSWAATFGETQTAIELAPEGTGYRAKTRFAKFFNLPELIALFKECADIQTADMLKLPVPEAEYENVVLKPSDYQKEMVTSLAERAEAVRDRRVKPYEDNMLKITNDGRKLALDQRLINAMLPDDEHSKTSACVENAFSIWKKTSEQKSAQLIFCDLSTPKGDGTFNVYEDIRAKLIEKGVPEDEIAFIHDANTEQRKTELFAKVRSGQVRFLLGSTAKMGAGTNVQDRLIALHHLDVPWRPSDIEQQEGRILRQGNQNSKVIIYRYVTEGTFDSYSWQIIENKQKFIGQIMTSKSPVRSCEDIDEAALSYAEVKALATGNPYIKEKMDLDIQVSKLKLLKANHTSQVYRLEDNIAKHYPKQITILKERISGFMEDIQTIKQEFQRDKEQFSMKVGEKIYEEKKEAGTALINMCKEIKAGSTSTKIGEYIGFDMRVSFDAINRVFVLNLKGKLSHNVDVGSDALGNITRINNLLGNLPMELKEAQTKLENVEHQLETAKIEVQKPFAQETELEEKLERLSAVNALLNMDEKGLDGVDMDDVEEQPVIEPLCEKIIEQMLPQFMKENEIEEENARNLLKDVFSNEEIFYLSEGKENSDGCIHNPELQQKIADSLESDYFMIPSEEYGFLVVPNKTGAIYESLHKLLDIFNQTASLEDLQSSQYVYTYEAEKKKLSYLDVASQTEAQLVAVWEKELVYDRCNGKVH